GDPRRLAVACRRGVGERPPSRIGPLALRPLPDVRRHPRPPRAADPRARSGARPGARRRSGGPRGRHAGRDRRRARVAGRSDAGAAHRRRRARGGRCPVGDRARRRPLGPCAGGGRLPRAESRVTRVDVAIVGLGYWGKNLLRTFARAPAARVAALCDVDATALARHAAEHPAADTVTDYAALLRRDDVQAIVLATPPSRHHAMARAALAVGKHVWVEKPLALTAADGRELVDAAAQSGSVLFVDETFLYDPLVREMKRIIDGGGLGDVYHLSFERLGMGRIKRDSNVWWNSGPHDISVLLYLVPRLVKRVQLHEH